MDSAGSVLPSLATAFNHAFLSALLTVIFIDIILSGDSRAAIAGAVRNLPDSQRRKGMLLGIAAAVAMRVGCAFVISHLMQIPLLKLAGGLAFLLSRLMRKFPILVLLGSLLLGKVGGEMVVTGPFLLNWLPHNDRFHHVGGAIGAAFVLGISAWAKRGAALDAAAGETRREEFQVGAP